MIVKGLKGLLRQLDNLEKTVDDKVMQVFAKYANIIYQEALSNLPSGANVIRSSGGVTVNIADNKVEIYFDGDLAGWIEFGTGIYAKNLLQSRPREWKDEAMKFFVNGSGRMPAQPYLYPAFINNRDKLIRDLDIEAQKWLTRIK